MFFLQSYEKIFEMTGSNISPYGDINDHSTKVFIDFNSFLSVFLNLDSANN